MLRSVLGNKGIDIKQLQIRIEIKKNIDKIGCLETKIFGR